MILNILIISIPVISKLVEYAILPTLAENFTQSTLQFGFTKGMSMLMVGFLISETRAEDSLPLSLGMTRSSKNRAKLFV
jgi:hypothetical protein